MTVTRSARRQAFAVADKPSINSPTTTPKGSCENGGCFALENDIMRRIEKPQKHAEHDRLRTQASSPMQGARSRKPRETGQPASRGEARFRPRSFGVARAISVLHPMPNQAAQSRIRTVHLAIVLEIGIRSRIRRVPRTCRHFRYSRCQHAPVAKVYRSSHSMDRIGKIEPICVVWQQNASAYWTRTGIPVQVARLLLPSLPLAN